MNHDDLIIIVSLTIMCVGFLLIGFVLGVTL